MGWTEEITYQRERVTSALCEELLPLIRRHHAEVAHFRDIPLEPDFEAYQAVDEAGAARVFTARAQGKLLGYAIFFVQTHFHSKGSKQAVMDLVFIEPESRGFGLTFLRWCDEQLQAEKVDVVLQYAKATHDFGPILKRLGYALIDQVYGRRLGRAG